MIDTVSPRRQFPRGRPALIAAAAGLLILGGGAGALAIEATRPSVTMVPATPVAIRSLADTGIVTIRGRVAEIYGNKFVMADPTGRALVETGRAGEDGALVKAGQPVTVQGRFERGFVHAAFLVGADGKVTALGPLGGPGHDGRGPHGRGGPRDHSGPDDADRPEAPVAQPAAPPAALPANAAMPVG